MNSIIDIHTTDFFIAVAFTKKTHRVNELLDLTLFNVLQTVDNLVFRNSRSWHYWHFCVTSNGNKLEIVVNLMNLNTN